MGDSSGLLVELVAHSARRAFRGKPFFTVCPLDKLYRSRPTDSELYHIINQARVLHCYDIAGSKVEAELAERVAAYASGLGGRKVTVEELLPTAMRRWLP